MVVVRMGPRGQGTPGCQCTWCETRDVGRGGAEEGRGQAGVGRRCDAGLSLGWRTAAGGRARAVVMRVWGAVVAHALLHLPCQLLL